MKEYFFVVLTTLIARRGTWLPVSALVASTYSPPTEPAAAIHGRSSSPARRLLRLRPFGSFAWWKFINETFLAALRKVRASSPPPDFYKFLLRV